MYLIIDGKVQVQKGQGPEGVLLAHWDTGHFFGEMALIEQKSRCATSREIEPTRSLRFSEPAPRPVLLQQPDQLHRIMQEPSSRLSAFDRQMIADLERKNEELARTYIDLQQAHTELVEKERLERELELALELQQSILPVSHPRVQRFRFAATSRPAHRVRGDLYDVISLRRAKVGLVMADVSDKGMPSVLYMALARSIVHGDAKR